MELDRSLRRKDLGAVKHCFLVVNRGWHRGDVCWDCHAYSGCFESDVLWRIAMCARVLALRGMPPSAQAVAIGQESEVGNLTRADCQVSATLLQQKSCNATYKEFRFFNSQYTEILDRTKWVTSFQQGILPRALKI